MVKWPFHIVIKQENKKYEQQKNRFIYANQSHQPHCYSRSAEKSPIPSKTGGMESFRIKCELSTRQAKCNFSKMVITTRKKNIVA